MLSLRSLYNNIKPPSWLPAGTDFHLFKAGIEPKWEDPQCEHGGKWTILVPKGAKQTIDKYWLHMVRARLPAVHARMPVLHMDVRASSTTGVPRRHSGSDVRGCGLLLNRNNWMRTVQHGCGLDC